MNLQLNCFISVELDCNDMIDQECDDREIIENVSDSIELGKSGIELKLTLTVTEDDQFTLVVNESEGQDYEITNTETIENAAFEFKVFLITLKQLLKEKGTITTEKIQEKMNEVENILRTFGMI
jgi:hypothetical protein